MSSTRFLSFQHSRSMKLICLIDLISSDWFRTSKVTFQTQYPCSKDFLSTKTLISNHFLMSKWSRIWELFSSTHSSFSITFNGRNWQFRFIFSFWNDSNHPYWVIRRRFSRLNLFFIEKSSSRPAVSFPSDYNHRDKFVWLNFSLSNNFDRQRWWFCIVLEDQPVSSIWACSRYFSKRVHWKNTINLLKFVANNGFMLHDNDCCWIDYG